MGNPINMDDLGVPLFLETSIFFWRWLSTFFSHKKLNRFQSRHEETARSVFSSMSDSITVFCQAEVESHLILLSVCFILKPKGLLQVMLNKNILSSVMLITTTTTTSTSITITITSHQSPVTSHQSSSSSSSIINHESWIMNHQSWIINHQNHQNHQHHHHHHQSPITNHHHHHHHHHS